MEQFNQQGFDAIERARILESKYKNLRERILIVNQNMVQGYKNSSTEIKFLNNNINELKKDMFEIKENIHKLIHDLQFFASKQDLKVLEKYINMWDPLNFVTQKDLEELLKKRGGKSTRSSQTRKKRK